MEMAGTYLTRLNLICEVTVSNTTDAVGTISSTVTNAGHKTVNPKAELAFAKEKLLVLKENCCSTHDELDALLSVVDEAMTTFIKVRNRLLELQHKTKATEETIAASLT